MHEALNGLRDELSAVEEALREHVPGDQGLNVQQNWQFSGLSGLELVEDVQRATELIDDCDVEDLGALEDRVNDYVDRLNVLHSTTIPNMHANPVTASSVALTMEGVRQVVSDISGTDADKAAEAQKRLRAVRNRLRNLEATLDELESRGKPLGEMVARIEEAHAAADRLPVDLQSLSEAQSRVSSMRDQVAGDQARVSGILEDAEIAQEMILKHKSTAKDVLDKSQVAYAAATSVGLASAFDERSKLLRKSIAYWTFGLAAALLLAVYLGSTGSQALLDLLGVKASSVDVQTFWSILSIGAPVWFAWLATKQIGQRFRISEDYGYKASIARAYEGFRREAERVGDDTEAALVGSALGHSRRAPPAARRGTEPRQREINMTKDHDGLRRKQQKPRPKPVSRRTDDRHLFGVERIDAEPEEIARALMKPRRT